MEETNYFCNGLYPISINPEEKISRIWCGNSFCALTEKDEVVAFGVGIKQKISLKDVWDSAE